MHFNCSRVIRVNTIFPHSATSGRSRVRVVKENVEMKNVSNYRRFFPFIFYICRSFVTWNMFSFSLFRVQRASRSALRFVSLFVVVIMTNHDNNLWTFYHSFIYCWLWLGQLKTTNWIHHFLCSTRHRRRPFELTKCFGDDLSNSLAKRLTLFRYNERTKLFFRFDGIYDLLSLCDCCPLWTVSLESNFVWTELSWMDCNLRHVETEENCKTELPKIMHGTLLSTRLESKNIHEIKKRNKKSICLMNDEVWVVSLELNCRRCPIQLFSWCLQRRRSRRDECICYCSLSPLSNRSRFPFFIHFSGAQWTIEQ